MNCVRFARSSAVGLRICWPASRLLRSRRGREFAKLEGWLLSPGSRVRPILLTHCGAGSNASVRDAASAAGAIGIAVLRRGGRALDAVVESIAVLEDDPRLNAGTGSRMRIDGRIQMDAALMDADLEAGGVAAIEEVNNPTRGARDVVRTPHFLLVGSDATAFARKMGHVRYDPATPESRRRLKESL